MAGREYDDHWMDNEERLLSTNLGEIQNAFRRYRNIIKAIKQELKEREDEVRDLKNRLSQMASERLTSHNPCVEDLSDKHRPTALAASWDCLFRSGAYWPAYEALDTGNGEQNPGQLLYSVTKTVYDLCAKSVQDVMTATSALLEKGALKSSVKSQLEWKWETKRKVDELFPNDFVFCGELRSFISDTYQKSLVDEISSLPSLILSKTLKFLKSRGPPKGLEKAVEASVSRLVSCPPHQLRGFVAELLRLCYFLRAQDIPLEADLRHDAGSTFDPRLFDAESGGAPWPATIRCVLRPPLLRNSGGPVLVRGEAEVRPSHGPDVGPQKPDIGPRSPDIGRQFPHIGRQNPHIDRQNTLIGTRSPNFGPQSPNIATQSPHIGTENPNIGTHRLASASPQSPASPSPRDAPSLPAGRQSRGDAETGGESGSAGARTDWVQRDAGVARPPTGGGPPTGEAPPTGEEDESFVLVETVALTEDEKRYYLRN